MRATARLLQRQQPRVAVSISFDNLTPGDYYVEFIPPAGYVISPQDQGGNDATDSDADSTTGQTITTTLDAGENDLPGTLVCTRPLPWVTLCGTT